MGTWPQKLKDTENSGQSWVYRLESELALGPLLSSEVTNMSIFWLPLKRITLVFQKQTPTWGIAVKARMAGKRLWASSGAVETSYALPSSSSSWAEAVGTGVVIQVKRLRGPSSRDAKPTWKQVHIMILLWSIVMPWWSHNPEFRTFAIQQQGSILLPKQAVNCRQIAVHGYQIHPMWSLCPLESQEDAQGAFSSTTHLWTGKWLKQTGRHLWMHPKTLPLCLAAVVHNTDPDSPASHLPDGAVKFSFPQ